MTVPRGPCLLAAEGISAPAALAVAQGASNGRRIGPVSFLGRDRALLALDQDFLGSASAALESLFRDLHAPLLSLDCCSPAVGTLVKNNHEGRFLALLPSLA
jgi:hypothetical protein